MKRRTPLRRSGFKREPRQPKVYELHTPRPRATAVARTDAPARLCVPVPKAIKARPGKRAPTVEERAWLDAIVSYGCVACRIDGYGYVPPAVHHIVRGGRRLGHLFSLPLCDPGHHQNGADRGFISRHPWKARFEARYGSEESLLRTVQKETGVVA